MAARTYAVLPNESPATPPPLFSATRAGIDVRAVPSLARRNPAEVQARNAEDAAVNRAVIQQAAADTRQQAAQAREQQRQTAAAEKQARRDRNSAMEQDFRAQGIRFFTNANGDIIPETDDTGKPRYNPSKGPTQWDPTTGRAFHVERDETGSKRQVWLDANSPVGPNPQDKNDPALYKQNKHSPWERYTVEEALDHDDEALRNAAAAHMHRGALRGKTEELARLNIEDAKASKTAGRPTSKELEDAGYDVASEDPATKARGQAVLDREKGFVDRATKKAELGTELLNLKGMNAGDFARAEQAKKRLALNTPGQAADYIAGQIASISRRKAELDTRGVALANEVATLQQQDAALGERFKAGFTLEEEPEMERQRTALRGRLTDLIAKEQSYVAESKRFNNWQKSRREDAEKADAARRAGLETGGDGFAGVNNHPLSGAQPAAKQGEAANSSPAPGLPGSVKGPAPVSSDDPADFAKATIGNGSEERDIPGAIEMPKTANSSWGVQAALKNPKLAGHDIYLPARPGAEEEVIVDVTSSSPGRLDLGKMHLKREAKDETYTDGADSERALRDGGKKMKIQPPALRELAKPELDAAVEESKNLELEDKRFAEDLAFRVKQMTEQVAAGKMTGDTLDASVKKLAELHDNEFKPRRDALYKQMSTMRDLMFKGGVPANQVVDMFRRAGVVIKDVPHLDDWMAAAAPSEDTVDSQRKRQQAALEYVKQFSDQPLYDEMEVAKQLGHMDDTIKGAALRALPWYQRWWHQAGNIGGHVAKIVPSTMQFVEKVLGRDADMLDWRRREMKIDEWLQKRGSVYTGESYKGVFTMSNAAKVLESVVPSVVETIGWTVAGAAAGSALTPGPGTIAGAEVGLMRGLANVVTRFATRKAIAAEASALMRATAGMTRAAAERVASAKILRGVAAEAKAGVVDSHIKLLQTNAKAAFGNYGAALASVRGNAGEMLANNLAGISMEELEKNPELMHRAVLPALAMGVPAGALDVVGPLAGAEKHLGKLFGSASLTQVRKQGLAAAREAIKDAAGAVSKEYLTGWGQGALGVISRRLFQTGRVGGAFTDKEMDEVWENAFLEAAGGGLMEGTVRSTQLVGELRQKRGIMQANRAVKIARERAATAVQATPDQIAEMISERTGTQVTAQEVAAGIQLAGPVESAVDVRAADAAVAQVTARFQRAFDERDWTTARQMKELEATLLDHRRAAAETHAFGAVQAHRELSAAIAPVLQQQAAAAAVGDQASVDALQLQADAIHRARGAVRIASGQDLLALPDAEVRALGYERDTKGSVKPIKGMVPAVTMGPGGTWIITDAAIAEARTVAPAAADLIGDDEITARAKDIARGLAAQNSAGNDANTQQQQGASPSNGSGNANPVRQTGEQPSPTVAGPRANNSAGVRRFSVTTSDAKGNETVTEVDAANATAAEAEVAGRGIGMVRDVTEISAEAARSSAPANNTTPLADAIANASQTLISEVGQAEVRKLAQDVQNTTGSAVVLALHQKAGQPWRVMASVVDGKKARAIGAEDFVRRSPALLDEALGRGHLEFSTVLSNTSGTRVSISAAPVLSWKSEGGLFLVTIEGAKEQISGPAPAGGRQGETDTREAPRQASTAAQPAQGADGSAKSAAPAGNLSGYTKTLERHAKAFGKLFKGVRMEAGRGATGGARFDPVSGDLIISEDDLMDSLAIAKDGDNYLLAVAAHEAIHAAAVELENRGSQDLARLWKRLPDEVKAAFRSAYPTSNEYQARHEFLRMVIEGKVKFSTKGITIEGLTELQMTPEALEKAQSGLAALLQAIVDFARNLTGTLSPQLAAEVEAVADKVIGIIRELQGDSSPITVDSGSSDTVLASEPTVSAPAGGSVSNTGRGVGVADSAGGGLTGNLPAADGPEWVNFPAETGTLSIPRANMPQIARAHRGALANFLTARGIGWSEEMVMPGSLKASQQEYSPAKVRKAASKESEPRSILVSADNYVVDGHHQWLAAMHRNPLAPVPIIRLGADIRTVLATVSEFPSSSTSEGGDPNPVPSTPAAEKMVRGNTVSLTVNGVKVRVQYVVQEAALARPSHDAMGNATPGYDQTTLQPRDRSLPQYRRQAQNIARDLDFAQAAYFPDTETPATTAEYGPPVMTRGGDTLIGNGREIGTVLSYKNGEPAAGRYREDLIRNAGKFGLDAAAVGRMKQPVLKRIILDDLEPAVLQRISQESNAGVAMASNVVELAGQDASRLTPDVLALLDPEYDVDAAQNRAFMTAYASRVIRGEGANEANTTAGELARRARMGIFAAAYGLDAQGRAAMDRMSGDADDSAKKITRALLTVAPLVARMRADIGEGLLHKRDISADIGAAAQRIAVELKDQKRASDAWAALAGDQSEMDLGDAGTMEPAVRRFLVAMRGDRGAIEEGISNYVEGVYRLGSPDQGDMFGGEPASAAELWTTATAEASGRNRRTLHTAALFRLRNAGPTRYETEEYPYLGEATEDWRRASHPEAAIVNPIEPGLSPDEKVDALRSLAESNVPLVETILAALAKKFQLRGKWSIKLPERVQAKASRPSIRAEKPWHDVEHIRDGLRFKVSLTHFNQTPGIMKVLQDHGIEVVKLDTAKMFAPKSWGWRFVAWDLRMPNGQLVEFYAPVPELDNKSVKGPNHHLFEKWRNVPELEIENSAALKEERFADIRESKNRYDNAFAAAWGRMGYTDETAAAASWNRLVALLESLMVRKRSASSAADAVPARQVPPLGLRKDFGTASTSISPSSASAAKSNLGSDSAAFTVEDSLDSDGRNPMFNVLLGTRRIARGGEQEDLLGLWAETVPPEVKASKPAFAKAAKTELPAAVLPKDNDSFGALFDFAQTAGYSASDENTKQPRVERPKPGRKPAAEAGVGTGLELFDFVSSAAGSDNEPSGNSGMGGLESTADAVGGGAGGSGRGDGRRNGQGGDADSNGSKSNDAANSAGSPAIPVRARIERPAAGSPERNFSYSEGDTLQPSGLKAKLKANLAALELLRTLESEDRLPTAQEKRTLASYSGWGALPQVFDERQAQNRETLNQTADRYESLARTSYVYKPLAADARQKADAANRWFEQWGDAYKTIRETLSEREWEDARDSTINAHYTAPNVIAPMWRALERFGFTGGNVLEPASGIGHFFGLMPEAIADRSKLFGVELDQLTARIAKKLYPEATIQNTGYQETDIPPGSIDVAISNVPFANIPIDDPTLAGAPAMSLHNYFFAKALQHVRPGGVVAFITTAHTMDSNIEQRRWLTKHGDLVGAIRLPNNAFKANAGTEVVTDIIFLRKPDGSPFNGEPWLKTNPVQLGENESVDVNEYFVRHPEMILGRLANDGTMYGGRKEMTVHGDGELEPAIERAINALPEGIMDAENSGAQITVNTGLTNRKPGMLYVEDGTVKRWMSSIPVPPGVIGEEFVEVRDSLNDLYALELSDASDAAIEEARANLNRLYDRFVSRHGNFHKRENFRHLSGDPDYYRLAGLEVERKPKPGTKVDAKAVVRYDKAPVFTRRVLSPSSVPDKFSSVTDAITGSIGWKGYIDVPWMAQRLGVPAEDLRKQLAENDRVFVDPENGQFTMADAYLSGNVRKKLAAARAAAAANPALQRNVTALEAVQPATVLFENLGPMMNLGAAWLPPKMIERWLKDEYDTEARVNFIPGLNEMVSDRWVISSSRIGARGESAGVEKMDVVELVQLASNLGVPTIKMRVPDGNGGSRDVYDQKATEQAKAAQDNLKESFTRWARGVAPELAAQMEAAYNERHNNYRVREYDGTHMVMPWVSRDFELYPAKKHVVWRAVSDRKMLVAHGVGGGKTILGTAIAMELKRFGLAKKPCIVVHNATLEQFAESISRMAPTASVLVARKEDLEGAKRKEFYGLVAAGDWDIVVMAHSTFNLISDDPEAERNALREVIDELKSLIAANGGEKAGKKDPSVKEWVKQLKRLQDRIKNLQARKQDDVLTFQEMGLDALILDESHLYKKLPFVTKITKVAGIDSGASKRGTALLTRARYIQERNRGGNVFTMTGTPVTNTLGETWNAVRLVAPELLKENRVTNFDAFVSTFAKIETKDELGAGNRYKRVTRLASIVGLPEWNSFFRQIADVKLGEEMSVKNRPGIAGGGPQLVMVPLTPGVQQFTGFIRNIADEFDKLKGKEKKEYSYVPLTLYSAARAASIDLRLVDRNAPDEPGSKVNAMVKRVMEFAKETEAYRGTQVIFADSIRSVSMEKLSQFAGGNFTVEVDEDADTDAAAETDEDGDYTPAEGGFNLYEEIKRKLVAAGLRPDEVALISEYKTPKAREKLFAAVNDGSVRVVVGSTQRLGTGVNMQRLMIAAHHLDVPWTPADIEQRDGRVYRQGNIHGEQGKDVHLIRYGMTDTLDAALWQKQETKARFTAQALSGKSNQREIEDDAALLSIQETKALLSGAEGLKLYRLTQDLRELEAAEGAWQSSRQQAQRRLAEFERELSDKPGSLARGIPGAEALRDRLQPLGRGEEVERTWKVAGETMPEKDAAKAINKLMEKRSREANEVMNPDKAASVKVPLMELEVNGVPLEIGIPRVSETLGDAKAKWKLAWPVFSAGKSIPQTGRDHMDGNAMVTSVDTLMNLVYRAAQVADEKASVMAGRLADIGKRKAAAVAAVEKPFEKAEELARVRKELDNQMLVMSGLKPETAAEETAELASQSIPARVRSAMKARDQLRRVTDPSAGQLNTLRNSERIIREHELASGQTFMFRDEDETRPPAVIDGRPMEQVPLFTRRLVLTGTQGESMFNDEYDDDRQMGTGLGTQSLVPVQTMRDTENGRGQDAVQNVQGTSEGQLSTVAGTASGQSGSPPAEIPGGVSQERQRRSMEGEAGKPGETAGTQRFPQPVKARTTVADALKEQFSSERVPRFMRSNLGYESAGQGWNISENMSNNASAAIAQGKIPDIDGQWRDWVSSYVDIPARYLTRQVLRMAVVDAGIISPEYHHMGNRREEVSFYDPEAMVRSPKFFLSLSRNLPMEVHKKRAKMAALTAWQIVRNDLIKGGDLGVWSFADKPKSSSMDELRAKVGEFADAVAAGNMSIEEAETMQANKRRFDEALKLIPRIGAAERRGRTEEAEELRQRIRDIGPFDNEVWIAAANRNQETARANEARGDKNGNSMAVVLRHEAAIMAEHLRTRSFVHLLKQAGADIETLDSDTERARQEVSGQRSTGRPELALGADDPIIMAVDENRMVERQTIEGWDAAAEQLLRDDYDGTVRLVMERGRIGGTLNPVETRAAQMIVARESRRKMTPAQQRRMQWLVWSYRMTGTEAARELAARRDPFKTPADRHREFLMRVIFTPPPAVRKQLEEADNAAEKERIMIEQSREVERIKKELARMGVTLDDVFGGEVALVLKSAPIVEQLTGKFDAGRKKAVELLQSGASFKEVAKGSGMSIEEVTALSESLHGQAKDAVRRKIQAMRERAQAELALRSQPLTGQVVDAVALAQMSDADAEAAIDAIAEKMVQQMGFLPKEKQGRTRRVKRKALFKPPPPRTAANEAAWQKFKGEPVGRQPFSEPQRLSGTTPPAYEGGQGEGRTKRGALDLGDTPGADEAAWQRFKDSPLGRQYFAQQGRMEGMSPPAYENAPGPGLHRRGRLDLGDLDADETITGSAEHWGKLLWPDAPAWEGEMLVPVGADMGRMEDVVKLARAVSLARATGFDMLTEFWINNLLSGPTTHVRNLVGNLVSFGWTNTIQRGVESLMRGEPAEMRYLWRGLAPGLAHGWRLAKMAWANEADFFKNDVLNAEVEFDGLAKGEAGKTAIPGMAGRIIRIPGRFLSFCDALFKGVLAQMEAGAQAYRIAKARGLTGDALVKRMNQELNTPGSQAWQLAVTKAEEATFQTKLKKMDEHATKAAGPVSYVARGAEASARFVMDLSNSFKLLKWLVPFVRTPFNILTTGLRMSPLGSVTLVEELVSGGLAKWKNGRPMTTTHPQLIQHLAEQMIAWTAAAVLAGAVEGGDDDDDQWLLVTGTKKKQGEKDLQDRTYPATSIRIFGKWFNYGSIEPVATALSVFADAVRTHKTGSGSLVATVRGQIDGKTFLQGLSRAWDNTERMADGKLNLSDVVLSQVIQTIVPNLIRQTARATDELERDWKSKDWWHEAFPSGAGAAARINTMTGDPVQKAGNFVTRLLFPFLQAAPEKITNADKMLLQWNRENPEAKYAPDEPDRKLKVRPNEKAVELGPKAYEYLQKRSAVLARDRMPALVAKVDERTKNAIKAAVEDGRQRAREELKRWKPELLLK